MSRLNDKIAKARLNVAIAEEQVSLAQDRLEYLEMKHRQYNQRAERKLFRKRLRDPNFRATQMLLRAVCREMFKPETSILQEYNGINKQIRLPRY